MNFRTALVAVVLSAQLVACGSQRAAALPTTVCALPGYAERLVQVDAEVRLRADGQAVISEPGCAAEPIELRLTGAATAAGLEQALQAALPAGASTVRLPVSITGVYATAADGNYFTAEQLTRKAAAP